MDRMVTLVSLESPCSACIIITNLLWEMIGLVATRIPGIHTQLTVLRDAKGVVTVSGASGTRFPILLLDDVQVCAGELIPRPQLEDLLTNGQKRCGL